MPVTTIRLLSLVAVVLGLAGCGTGYRWRASVPREMRTVSVPTFRNVSDVAEIGPVAARMLLREFQREGTFSIRAPGDAALEIQGTIRKTTAGITGYDRVSGMRHAGYELDVEAEVSVVDKRAGKVLVDNRRYHARTEYAAGQDMLTAKRDATGRAAEDLARQIVDDVLNLKW